MKRGFETAACGLEHILLFTVLIVAGLLPTVRAVWGEDITFTPSQPAAALPAAPSKDVDDAFDVDQVRAQVTFLSVPTELVEATIVDWTLAPFDQNDLAEADPFAAMNQPLRGSRAKSGDKPDGHVAAGTEMCLPCTHKILNDQEARKLTSFLEADERTQSVFRPQLTFIDGMTATAVVGEKRPFVVGWSDNLPQTRFVPQGKMVRLRTVFDDDKMWIDYEIVLSRILDVTSRTIRIANRRQPITLAVPNVETTKAAANVALPAGGTLLIGGLPAASKNGVPHQLLVLVRANRTSGIRMKKIAKPDSVNTEQTIHAFIADLALPTEEPVSPRPRAVQKKRNPFSLISRILNRAPQQAVDPQNPPARKEFNIPNDAAPMPPK